MDVSTTDSKMRTCCKHGHKSLNPPESLLHCVRLIFHIVQQQTHCTISLILLTFFSTHSDCPPPRGHVSFRHTAVYTYRQYTKFYYKKKNPFYKFSKFHIKNDGKHFSFNQTTDKSWQ